MKHYIALLLALVVLAIGAAAHAQSGADEVGVNDFDVPTVGERIVQLKAAKAAIEALESIDGDAEAQRVVEAYYDIEIELARLEGRDAEIDIANGDGTTTTVVLLQRKKETEKPKADLRRQHAAKVAQLLLHSLKGVVHSCMGLNGFAEENRQTADELEYQIQVLKSRIKAERVEPSTR